MSCREGRRITYGQFDVLCGWLAWARRLTVNSRRPFDAEMKTIGMSIILRPELLEKIYKPEDPNTREIRNRLAEGGIHITTNTAQASSETDSTRKRGASVSSNVSIPLPASANRDRGGDKAQQRNDQIDSAIESICGRKDMRPIFKTIRKVEATTWHRFPSCKWPGDRPPNWSLAPGPHTQTDGLDDDHWWRIDVATRRKMLEARQHDSFLQNDFPPAVDGYQERVVSAQLPTEAEAKANVDHGLVSSMKNTYLRDRNLEWYQRQKAALDKNQKMDAQRAAFQHYHDRVMKERQLRANRSRGRELIPQGSDEASQRHGSDAMKRKLITNDGALHQVPKIHREAQKDSEKPKAAIRPEGEDEVSKAGLTRRFTAQRRRQRQLGNEVGPGDLIAMDRLGTGASTASQSSSLRQRCDNGWEDDVPEDGVFACTLDT